MSNYPINKFVTVIGQNRPAKLLFLSLGNPSPQFDGTKHSAGHMALDYFIKEMGGLSENEMHWDKSVEVSPLKNHPNVYMARSLEFMNNSGKALQAAKRKLHDCKTIIIHDDIDTNPGMAKFKLESLQMGAHGGLSSICKLREPFPRIRLGIGSPESRMHGHVASYVMKKFSTQERDVLMNETIPHAFNYFKAIVEMFEKPIKKRTAPIKKPKLTTPILPPPSPNPNYSDGN